MGEGTDQPDDSQLIAAVAGGDPLAIRQLIDRYDRLVRYAVFRMSRQRCHRDPLWLDSVASEAWTDICRSVGQGPPVRHLHSYVIQIARRRCIDRLRQWDRVDRAGPIEAEDGAQVIDKQEDTIDLLGKMEDLTALRECVAGLVQADRALFGEVEAITAGRWREAGGRLGMPESTLRSHWKRILGALRQCMDAKGRGPV
ncbi:MAG: RNA polymerase sigma factor [Phycisphaerae bacterium]